MKYKFSATLLPMLMIASVSSYAAESATINIKGTIVPTPCSLTISESVDYGETLASTVASAGSKGYALPEKKIPVNVSCAAAMPVALSIQADDIASSNSSIELPNMGAITESNKKLAGVLGMVNDKPIGYYNITPVSAESGNEPLAYLSRTSDGGVTWEQTWMTEPQPAALDDSEWISTGGHSDPNTTNATITFAINASLDSKAAVSVKDKLIFNTNSTVSIRYF